MSFKNEFISLLKRYGIVKADKQEEMISYEVVYEPDVKDGHEEWMSKETIEKACTTFNTLLASGDIKANLFHVEDTDAFSIVDSWIQKEFDVTVDETGEPIKAGTWVAKLQYHNVDVWELKKANVLGGVSIGAWGNIDEETGEITNLVFEEPEEEGDE